MSLSQHVQPHRAPAPLGIVASLVVAALGGFVGGMLIEHGPTYLNVHVTQPVLGQSSEPSELISEVEPVAAPVAEPETDNAEILARGAESRIVVHAQDAAYIVLQHSANRDWGTGAIRSSNRDDFLVTLRQSVSLAALPPEYSAWLKAPVTLFDSRGYACSATVETLELLEQYAGEGMSLETWDEYGDGPLLVARLAASKGKCTNAVWGRHAELAAPSIGRITRGTKGERREARKVFRASAAYRTLQAQFLEEGHKGNWDAFWEGRLSISVVRSPEQELVFVQAQVGGCGEFNAQLGTIFERQEDGTLQALASDNTFLAGIAAAADVDGDGDLDIVTQGDLYDRTLNLHNGSGLSVHSQSLVGIYYCRC